MMSLWAPFVPSCKSLVGGALNGGVSVVVYVDLCMCVCVFMRRDAAWLSMRLGFSRGCWKPFFVGIKTTGIPWGGDGKGDGIVRAGRKSTSSEDSEGGDRMVGMRSRLGFV
ncbi:hypothetical protein LZ31DRAFT_345401 [Colletotrichum somersetense]|nr:hypothetical protein LZ31DRAFT_345401 [Colletotrichum somersetense]